MDEIWKKHPIYSLYECSSQGNVRSTRYNKPLKKHEDRYGYLVVKIYHSFHDGTYSKNKTIHRLVTESFIGLNPLMQVNHKDGDKKNNQLTNLEYCTPSENTKHSYRTGLQKPKYKYSSELVEEIKQHKIRGKKNKEISIMLNIPYDFVYRVTSGKKRQ